MKLLLRVIFTLLYAMSGTLILFRGAPALDALTGALLAQESQTVSRYYGFEMQEEHVSDDRAIDAAMPGLALDSAALYRRFSRARPFPHVVIDDFLDSFFAFQLLAEFPDPINAQPNEFGSPGAKAVHSDLTVLGRTYRRLHDLLSSSQFLRRLGRVTGIDGLLYDTDNFGGGTHENFDDRDLLPHVDFNIHPVTKYHRRVNLIIYLNLEWNDAWGGAIELHRDPRDPLDETVSYSPTSIVR